MPNKTKIIDPVLNNIPERLKEFDQWVVWNAVNQVKKDGSVKISKEPCNVQTGKTASAQDSKNWLTFDAAADAYLYNGFSGIGFVFTEDDPFVGIDLDGCVKGKEVSNLAKMAVNTCKSFAEVSVSGTGVHIIGEANMITDGIQDHTLGVEMYSAKRYLTVTAKTFSKYKEVVPMQEAVDLLFGEWFGQKSLERVEAGSYEPDESAPIISLEDMPIRDEWKALVKGGEGVCRYEKAGDESGEGDRSQALFFAAKEMIANGINKESVMNCFTNPDNFLGEVALDRRKGSVASARQWLWKYVVGKIIAYREQEKGEYDAAGSESVFLPAGTQKIVPFNQLSLSPPDWLIEGVFEKNSLVILFAPPGTGKTFITIDMLTSVLLGVPWNQHSVSKSPVVIVAGEGHRGLVHRVYASCYEKGVSKLSNLYVSKCPFLLGDETHHGVSDLIQEIDRNDDPPGLVVIDTLARNNAGDENSTGDMTRLINSFDRIRVRYGCAVFVVHHTAKGDQSQGRGSGALRGAADSEFCIKSKANFTTLVNTKQKDSEPMAPIGFSLRRVEFNIKSESGETLNINSCVVDYANQCSSGEFDISIDDLDPKTKIVWDVFLKLSENGDVRLKNLRGSARNELSGEGVSDSALHSRWGRAFKELTDGGILYKDGDFVRSNDAF